MLMLAQRWPYVVYPTPTISQRSNGLPTLAQRSHAIWVSANQNQLFDMKVKYMQIYTEKNCVLWKDPEKTLFEFIYTCCVLKFNK